MSSPAATVPSPPRSGLRAAWGRLDHRQRRVGAAVALVLATLVLPWYSEVTITQREPGSVVRSSGSVSALAGMSFIEASILVVLIAVLALLWGRGTDRRFALPFPDGSLVCGAAGWMGALIVYRLFARPHGVDSAQVQTLVGLNWGIFASLVAVGVLFAAGFDLRRHGPRSVVPGEPEPAPPTRYPDVDPATVVVRPRSDDPPTEVVPNLPRDDQPTRVSPAIRPHPDDQPTVVGPSPRTPRRTPSPPVRPDGEPASPGHDAWPSRMRRPQAPTPGDPAVDRSADPADERRGDEGE